MPKKILIIDDDSDICSYLKDVFEDAGYTTEIARNGVEGLEKAQVSPPDLITLDMDMPRRGGTSFYVKLRREPILAEIPVVVITGVAPTPVLAKDIPVLSKPIDPQKTLSVVKSLLGE
jgi:two-component system, cell cycle response regulator DivK